MYWKNGGFNVTIYKRFTCFPDKLLIVLIVLNEYYKDNESNFYIYYKNN